MAAQRTVPRSQGLFGLGCLSSDCLSSFPLQQSWEFSGEHSHAFTQDRSFCVGHSLLTRKSGARTWLRGHRDDAPSVSPGSPAQDGEGGWEQLAAAPNLSKPIRFF